MQPVAVFDSFFEGEGLADELFVGAVGDGFDYAFVGDFVGADDIAEVSAHAHIGDGHFAVFHSAQGFEVFVIGFTDAAVFGGVVAADEVPGALDGVDTVFAGKRELADGQ